MIKNSQKKELQMLEKCVNDNNCDEFVKQYWNLIYYMVIKLFVKRKYSYSELDVENLVSEVFFQMINNDRRKLRLYNKDKGAKISVWISFIVQSTVSNFFRKKEIEYTSDDNIIIDSKNYTEFSDTRMESRVLSKIDIEKALKTLSQKDQDIIKFLDYEGLSAKEVGLKKNMNEKSVLNRKVHIKKQLALFFQQDNNFLK